MARVVNLAAVAEVARRLEALNERVVFVGGAVLPLLVSDPLVVRFRETDDIDAIVEVTTRSDYYKLSEQVQKLGFQPDAASGVICRWKLGSIVVDLMPPNEEVLGFSNSWYDLALRTAARRTLPSGESILLITPVAFLATKAEAFQGRGNGDFLASHDVEDFVTLIDARAEIVGEVERSEEEVRAFLAAIVRTWLSENAFLDALPGHVEQGQITSERVRIVRERLERIAAR